MASTRRRGIESSATRAQLLDAAEKLMREEGYPAVTTRRLAAELGVSNQLVHYYFRTMDDLFLSLMRRRAETNLQGLMKALASPNPVRALWDFNSDLASMKLAIEFVALTNHRKLIGEESARHAEQLRALETEALARVLSDNGIEANRLPAVCLAVLMSSLPRTMAMEAGFGVSLGHRETLELIESYLRRFDKDLEPPPRQAAKRRRAAKS
jgi:AcrR family transcriptional regulator